MVVTNNKSAIAQWESDMLHTHQILGSIHSWCQKKNLSCAVHRTVSKRCAPWCFGLINPFQSVSDPYQMIRDTPRHLTVSMRGAPWCFGCISSFQSVSDPYQTIRDTPRHLIHQLAYPVHIEYASYPYPFKGTGPGPGPDLKYSSNIALDPL